MTQGAFAQQTPRTPHVRARTFALASRLLWVYFFFFLAFLAATSFRLMRALRLFCAFLRRIFCERLESPRPIIRYLLKVNLLLGLPNGVDFAELVGCCQVGCLSSEGQTDDSSLLFANSDNTALLPSTLVHVG